MLPSTDGFSGKAETDGEYGIVGCLFVRFPSDESFVKPFLKVL